VVVEGFKPNMEGKNLDDMKRMLEEEEERMRQRIKLKVSMAKARQEAENRKKVEEESKMQQMLTNKRKI